MIRVIKYSKEYKDDWNEFLSNSKNSTFLFNRNFMDYHANKFEDYSLMIYLKDKLSSVLPLNIYKNKIFSHQGLSYGGFVFAKDETLNNILKIIRSTLKYLFENNYRFLYYKSIPKFYNTIGCDEIDYAFFILKAKLYRRDSALCVSLKDKLKYQNRRKRSITKAIKQGVTIKESASLAPFWNKILIPNLLEKYGVSPVHKLKEISLLADYFPENIKQYNAYLNNIIVAGTTIFETPTVAHAQYISASEIGKKSGALDLLFDSLISNIYRHKLFFDFGISNEKEGKVINHGLLDWKEGFGGRAISHDFYIIKTINYQLLENVIK